MPEPEKVEPPVEDEAVSDAHKGALKSIIREVLDEFVAEEKAPPKRTEKSKGFLDSILGLG